LTAVSTVPEAGWLARCPLTVRNRCARRLSAASDQTLTFEAQQDARERAGVQTQQVRQFPGSDAGKSSDQAQPKPLRPGEPQTAGHVL